MLIRVNGDSMEIAPDTPKGYSLRQVQTLVGDGTPVDVEMIRIPGDSENILLVDEAGRMKNLPSNTEATKLARILIVGTAIVIPITSMQ